MPFHGAQTMAQIAFVMLEGTRKVLMAARHPPAGPLLIGVQPTEHPFLQLRQTGYGHTPPLPRSCRLPGSSLPALAQG